jgi:hypothetical protein
MVQQVRSRLTRAVVIKSTAGVRSDDARPMFKRYLLLKYVSFESNREFFFRSSPRKRGPFPGFPASNERTEEVMPFHRKSPLWIA